VRPGPVRDAAELVATVQFNCDLADARHARESALCTYLLGMREYYRWSTGAACGTALEHGAVGRWIAERESAWEQLCDRGAAYRPLPLGSGIDPFDEDGANEALHGRGLFYGAGIGRFGVPLFFLSETEREDRRGDVAIVIAARELARGVVAPPALSRGHHVVVRADALRRWLWTRLEGQRRQTADPALAALLHWYGGDDAATIDRIVQSEIETLVLHELGEVQAAGRLGPDWERMLAGIDSRHAEIVLRAVRDLFADCLVTLPTLIERGAIGSLHFWYANLDGARRALAPEFAALHESVARGDVAQLAAAARRALAHWESVAADLLQSWRAAGAQAVSARAQSLLQEPRPQTRAH